MSLIKIKYLENDDTFTMFEVYRCDECFKEIPECYPRVNIDKDKHLCWDCGFKNGFVEEKEYLEHSGISLTNAHASVHNGEVKIWVGKRTLRERS